MKKYSIYLIICLLVTALTSYAQQTEQYTWNSVAIGGGGFVSGLVMQKTATGPLIYARTDVGGAYRWDNSTSRWLPLTDWVSDQETGYLGVESIAIDPQQPDRVYMLVGISYFNSGKTAILRSADAGRTFSVVNVTAQFKAHGNGMGRQNGEKLQVDPLNSNILYCGTRYNGLFKSTDAGVTWTRMAGLNVTTTPNENGISFVVLDKSANAGGKTNRLFVGISRSATPNLLTSADGGESFTAIANPALPATFMPQRAVLDGAGNLFITYANGAGPHGSGTLPEPVDNGQIWKYAIASGTWTNVTPQNVARAFSGISVDPANPQRLVASTTNTYLLQQANVYGDRLFLSENGGQSWTDVVSRGFSMNPNGISWISGQSIHWAGCIEFDPADSKKVWVTSGNGIFVNNDISASAGVWTFTVAGLEETVPLGFVSIPNGPAISVIGDYDGFRHTNVQNYAAIHQPRMGTTTGLAFAPANTSKLLRVGEKMYYSLDQGVTWTECTINGKQGQVAISQNGPTDIFLHAPASSNVTYQSTNRGVSWSPVTGLSFNEARPIVDMVNPNKFYAYNPSNGSLLVSDGNNGAAFTAAGTTSSGGSKVIRAIPGKEGHVWIALYGQGLARTTNSGQTIAKVAGVTYCGAIGFGKAVSASAYPTLFMWGTVNNVLGIYRSTDEGSTWTRLNDDAHEYGGPGNGQFMLGDMNIYGRVYMSTAGRGVIYGETNITPAEPILAVDEPKTSLVKAFPNPATGEVTLTAPEAMNGRTVLLLNAAGREVLSTKLSGSSLIIDMSPYPAGTYLIRTGTDEKQAVIKILKQ
ncbi:T9SS type A sorting domain-containing protein [uncultured Fibrella sp.]|uniref:T9SS type A sorting domain-containing protein n=1 Tax=uncultured Fibrella sp. TaxID=1284596 RepID=UPI0035CA1678